MTFSRDALTEIVGQIVMHYKFTPIQTEWFFNGPPSALHDLDRKLQVSTPMSDLVFEIDYDKKVYTKTLGAIMLSETMHSS